MDVWRPFSLANLRCSGGNPLFRIVIKCQGVRWYSQRQQSCTRSLYQVHTELKGRLLPTIRQFEPHQNQIVLLNNLFAQFCM